MAWTPTNYTRNGETTVADTAADGAQLEWDGWLPVGQANKAIQRDVIAAPVRPTDVPNGTVWIKTII